jgi:hypothetical protein
MQRMPGVQTDWRDQFRVADEDIETLADHLLEQGEPRSTEALARWLMERRVQALETEHAASRPADGGVYQPKQTYDVGQTLTFPALHGATGVVVAVRSGDNPAYGEFSVVRVQFDDGTTREFASGLGQPHPLNIEEAKTDLEAIDREYGRYIQNTLRRVLSRAPDFVHVGDRWFLADLMPNIHIGHLNIAEAMIEMADHPLTTDELLGEVELESGVPRTARHFAMEYALTDDERFVNVGPEEAPRWALAHQQATRSR